MSENIRKTIVKAKMSEYIRKPIVKILMLKGQQGISIKEIKKTSTSGLTDTYEISLTDGTKRTFNVSNGKGVKSIAKTSTSGLVDTYTITYNDGTTSTFTVRNGEKGDTGSTENILNKTYPVGSIYMSVNSTDPSTLFGGTWQRLKGRFLIGAGAVADTNSNTSFGSLGAEKPDIVSGETGGEYYHQLNATEMPEHNHDTNDWTIVANKNGTRITTNLGAKCLSEMESTNMVPNIKATKNDDGNRTGHAGGGGKHNNMPPYLAVFMWKRTA
jgi:hypothetical protein